MNRKVTKPSRVIPAELSIKLFMHCSQCLDEKPGDISPRDFAMLEIGWTALGFQVWCKRHGCNVCHVDFEGHKHPANTFCFDQ
jgi:hypothetical protein